MVICDAAPLGEWILTAEWLDSSMKRPMRSGVPRFRISRAANRYPSIGAVYGSATGANELRARNKSSGFNCSPPRRQEREESGRNRS